jgi:hypothetical protein
MATVTFSDWWLISFTCVLNRAGMPVEFLRIQSPLVWTIPNKLALASCLRHAEREHTLE